MDAAPEVTPVTEALPPKVVSQNARRMQGAEEPPDGVGVPATWRQTTRLERRLTGNFPVLQAFQDFIETERQRSRRQMVLLASIFSVILIGVLAVSVMLGLLVYSRTRIDLGGLQAEVAALRSQSSTIGTAVHAQIATIENTANRLQSRLDAQLQESASTSPAPDPGAVESLRRDLESLEQRNAELAHDLATVRNVVPSLSADLGTVVNLIENLQQGQPAPAPSEASATAASIPEPRGNPAGPASVPAVALPTESPSAPAAELALVITLPGSAEPLPWRLVIPE